MRRKISTAPPPGSVLADNQHHTLNTACAEARTIIIATHRELVQDLADALLQERELTRSKLSYQLDKIRRGQRRDKKDGSEPTNRIMHLALD